MAAAAAAAGSGKEEAVAAVAARDVAAVAAIAARSSVSPGKGIHAAEGMADPLLLLLLLLLPRGAVLREVDFFFFLNRQKNTEGRERSFLIRNQTINCSRIHTKTEPSLTWWSHGGCVDRGLATPRCKKEIDPGRLRDEIETTRRCCRCRRSSLVDAQSSIVPGCCCCCCC